MDTLWQIAGNVWETEVFFRLLVIAIVVGIAALLISLIIEENRKYQKIHDKIQNRIAEGMAKRGIKPEVELPWYYNPAVSDFIAGLSGFFGFTGRVSDFFARVGNSLLGFIKKGLGGILAFIQRPRGLLGPRDENFWDADRKGRLLLAAKFEGLLLLGLIAAVPLVLLAVLYALVWLLVLIPGAGSWAFSATSGWLKNRAEEIRTRWAEREEIRGIRQNLELTPDGIVFYHEVEDSFRTGKFYKGFLPKEAVAVAKGDVAPPPGRLVLLINGSGFLFENPVRLRRLTKMVDAPGEFGEEPKKVEVTVYDETEIFEGLAAAGPVFEWRASEWRLLAAGNCEVELHGSHPHFRSVNLVPFERVRYWLATMVAGEGENKEGPKEVLLVEEILGSWGGHHGVLRVFAWTGIELPEGEVEEARTLLASFNPEEIKPAIPAYAIE